MVASSIMSCAALARVVNEGWGWKGGLLVKGG